MNIPESDPAIVTCGCQERETKRIAKRMRCFREVERVVWCGGCRSKIFGGCETGEAAPGRTLDAAHVT